MAVTIPSATEQITYADLYARWERGNWCATEIDFSQDVVDWRERLTPIQRQGALWLYALFFHGEDSVAGNLSPYIDAAPLEEQKYFLATQQVDEARHSVFFKRFVHEVVGLGDGTMAGGLRATEAELTWGHRKTFAYLDRMADALRSDHSKPKLAEAITLYHVIVEAALAQPGQHMIDDSLERMDVLPGFRAGMRNVALDEQRHIAFGVKLLSDLYREDPERIQAAIVRIFRQSMGWTIGVGYPPGGDRAYTESFGFSLEDLYEEGARSVEAKLRAVGLPVDALPNFPYPMELPARERGARAIRLLAAGLAGPRSGAISRDPDDVALMFDGIRRQADPAQAPAGTTIQWDFTDAERWHLSLDNGETLVARGRAAHPSLTLRVGFDDFVDSTAGRVDPRRLILRGRMRPRGDLRLLLRLPRVFG